MEASPLLQTKRGNAGHATLECFDRAVGCKAFPLNVKIDLMVSWKPQFEETIL